MPLSAAPLSGVGEGELLTAHQHRPFLRRYHELYLQVKGNRYKTKRTLMETIHKTKAEKNRVKAIEDQANSAKTKAAIKVNKKTKSKDAKVAAQ